MTRFTRATRFLPRLRGVGRILQPARFLSRPFHRPGVHRIDDFDGDLSLEVDTRELIGAALWFIPQIYEWRERELFCSAIRPGAVVLDVGANLGIYTLLAAKRGAHVFAIEADPQNAAMLRWNVVLNRFDKAVRVYELGASDHNHTAGIRRNTANSGGSTLVDGDLIQCRAIDSLGLPPVDVCKMDIEGFELNALHGMAGTISRSLSLKLLVECNHHSDQATLRSFLMTRFKSIVDLGQNLWCRN